MTEPDVYSLIGELCAGKVFPYVAPQGTTAPWVVFSFPTDMGDDVLCGQSGAVTTSIQIDAYAQTIDEATLIREQAKALIKPLMPASLMGTKGYESDTGLYRATVEVQVLE